MDIFSHDPIRGGDLTCATGFRGMGLLRFGFGIFSPTPVYIVLIRKSSDEIFSRRAVNAAMRVAHAKRASAEQDHTQEAMQERGTRLAELRSPEIMP